MKRPLKVSLRTAAQTDQDCKVFFDARNDPVSRKYSRHPEEIAFGTHVKWFSDAIRDSRRRLYIVELDGKPAGYCRAEGAENEVSIALLSEYRGKHIGSEALRLLSESLEATPLKAVIRSDNAASKVAFERAGFRKASSDGQWETWLKASK